MDDRSIQLKRLYIISLSAISEHISRTTFKKEYYDLPAPILFDIYYQLYLDKRLSVVENEFSDIEIFTHLLKLPNKRVKLLESFQGLREHSPKIMNELIASYQRQTLTIDIQSPKFNTVIDNGLRLGGFLCDCGWYNESAQVLQPVERLCRTAPQTSFMLHKLLECYHKLLHVQAMYYNFPDAVRTHKLTLETIEKLNEKQCVPNLAGLFAEFSVLFFVRSEYDLAYKWSIESLKHITPDQPPRVIVDVLRQASKSCVIKRHFKKAGLLIKQAVYFAQAVFGNTHPKFSDVLMDYGFYLLNFDCMLHSVKIYKTALDIIKHVLGKSNLKVAVGHEDLAYALYVHEYSSGRFYKAREHSERAIKIMESLVPKDHLMLASAKRVKALILEEIALDTPATPIGKSTQIEYLKESEDLHLDALKLSLNSFGEKNVQTAKHYGNLGRLYQSMRKFKEAEKMHLKAIAIKEEILGGEDYEVGLSVGHLASLYNYHMKQFREAEKLYLRSIAISLKLFGSSYSGLEYDYRGLGRVYLELKEMDRVVEYSAILGNWMMLRDQHVREEVSPIDFTANPRSLNDVVSEFFLMS